MRNLSLTEVKEVSGSDFNVVVMFDDLFYLPQPTYYYYPEIMFYEPMIVSYYSQEPLFNAWGDFVGYETYQNYYLSYEPVYYYY